MREEGVTKILVGIEPLVIGEGFELIDVMWVTESARRVLRVYIDRPAGVTLADCEKVSRVLGDVLDVKDWISGRYNLEVSSPGLDRPLRTAAHFERFFGQTAVIVLDEPQDGRKHFKGELIGWKDPQNQTAARGLVLRVDQQDFVLPFQHIGRAHLVAQFD